MRDRRRVLAQLSTAAALVCTPALCADIANGDYEIRNPDGLYSGLTVSGSDAGAKQIVQFANAIADFHVCKLTAHVRVQYALPPNYNQNDYVNGTITQCTATDNTCGSAPTCRLSGPARFTQESPDRLCISIKSNPPYDQCYPRVRATRPSMEVEGVVVEFP